MADGPLGPHLVLPLGDYCKFQNEKIRNSETRRGRHGQRQHHHRHNHRHRHHQHHHKKKLPNDVVDVMKWLDGLACIQQDHGHGQVSSNGRKRPITAQASCQTALTSEQLSSFDLVLDVGGNGDEHESQEHVEMALHFRLRRLLRGWRSMSIVQKVNLEPKRKSIFLALSAISLGVDVHKGKILKRRKDGLANARENLSQKLRRRSELNHEIITTEMLKVELRKMFYDELYKWNRKRDLSMAFSAMKSAMVEARERNARSRYKSLKGSFDAWSEWTVERRNMWEEGTRRTPRYEQELVDRFASQHPIRVPFRRWYVLSRLYTEVKRRRRVIFTRIARHCFQAWREDSKVCRELRLRAVDKWVNFRKRILCGPFREWHGWMVKVKKDRCDRERFLYSHQLMKQRRMLRRLFGHWKNRIIYGRMTFPHSRSDLLKQLSDQQCEIHDLKRRLEGYESIDNNNNNNNNKNNCSSNVMKTTVSSLEETTNLQDSLHEGKLAGGAAAASMREIESLRALLKRSRMETEDLKRSLDTVEEWKMQSSSLRNYITSRQVFAGS